MKKLEILVLCFLTIYSIALNAQQINCASSATPEYLQELDNMLNSTEGCVDDLSAYNSNDPITLNLLLSYGQYGTGQGEFEDSDFEYIENEIKNVFEPQNIHFNIMWHNLDCDDCLTSYYDNPAWPEFFEGTTCIQGHIVTAFADTGNIGGEAFGIGKGKFWGKVGSIPHELGHAIGLLHTHQPESGYDFITSELVTRDIPSNEQNPCSCNCLSTGDRICDTPPDPNIGFASTPEELAWTSAMFDGCELTNDNTETDLCGDLFADPNMVIQNNVMSYHCDDPNGVARLTEGQSHRIRMMLDNENGTYKFEYDPNQMPFSSGLVVNNTATLNSNEAFNGNIIVNSDLTIENCIIELTEGHKIIVNAGASISIKNSTIRTYTGEICYFQKEGKVNWEGIEILPGSSDFTRVSILNNSILKPSEAGIYNIEGSTGLAKLKVYNSIVEVIDGTTIDLSNVSGTNRLRDSKFSNTVKVTNADYLRVLGCDFDFVTESLESGITALDTRLYLQKYYEGSGTFSNNSFINCGVGVEFISSSALSCRISNSDFTNVLTGIKAKNVAGFLKVNDCNMNLRNPYGTQGFGKGILIDNFVDFDIYDNSITGSCSGLQKGIEIVYTGLNDNPNLLINNIIADCNNGIVSASASLGSNMSGVEFECNEMINIISDNFVTTNIGPHQGRGGINFAPGDWRPAGNKFDGSTSGFEDFNYTGAVWTQQKTYHYRDLGLENIENFNTGNFNPAAPDQFVIDELNSGEVPQCTYPIIDKNPDLPSLPTAYTHFTSMFDGGSTDDNIKLIFSDSDNDPTGVLIEIMDDSPWVSISVVQAIFANSQYYTESQIAQLIVQNPGVLSDEYISEVVFETNSFSSNNQQLMLEAYQAGDSRITHEQSLLDVIYNGTLHIKKEMSSQLENENFNEVTIRSLLTSKISSTKLYQTIESYVNDGDYTNALATMSSKIGVQTFDPILLDEATVYTEVLTLGEYLYANGESWTKISANDKTRLINIANNYHGLATVKARNILSIYHNMTFGDLPSKPYSSPIRFAGSSARSSKHSELVKVYPNPTNDILNVDINEGQFRYIIEILSLDGVLVKTVISKGSTRIDVSELTNGIYFYTISNENEVILTQKLIIID